MSEAKFTKGPWKTDVDDVVSSSDGAAVALVCNRTDVAANAKLIAAAPELYEALKACIDGKVREHRDAAHSSGRFCTVCGQNRSDAVHHPQCPINLAEIALAKATH